MSHHIFFRFSKCLLLLICFSVTAFSQKIRVGVFEVNASPPIGSPVAYAVTRSITDSLSARGIVVLSADKPVVLCVVDWIGISNEGQDRWRRQVAAAAGTTIDRVSIHTLHQHDAPRCDFTIERIMEEYGLGGRSIDNTFTTDVIQRTAAAVKKAISNAQVVTAVGWGQAKVDSVASNRRIMDADGNITTRWSSTKDSAMRAAPEGLIDPWLKCISFWNGNKAIALLTYYTTHPQSYYGTGDVTCEFVGIARNAIEKQLGIPSIHFNGASGNIAAGKYNDGSAPQRIVLARHVEEGMKKAWLNTKKYPLRNASVAWSNVEVALPLGANIIEADLRHRMTNDSLNIHEKFRAAEKLAWYQRSTEGHKVNISSLKLGNIWLLNIPGEAFVEYQLAAQKMRPQDVVCTAAYEEYGPGYIGTKASYFQKGGYETSDIVSGVSPDVESVLLNAIRTVLK
ncbi:MULTISPECIES: hypothetical protein [unclassified Chitinophaga]|uniref:hypothetical protein n=1 Tax=unclassified Chitinophaga TaxID=2619133 RepID=UPI00300FB642